MGAESTGDHGGAAGEGGLAAALSGGYRGASYTSPPSGEPPAPPAESRGLAAPHLVWAPSGHGPLSEGLSADCYRFGAEGSGRPRVSAAAGVPVPAEQRSPLRGAGLCSLRMGLSRWGKRETDGKGNLENSPHLRFFLIFDFNCVGRIFRFLWIIRGHGPATEVRTLSGNCFVLDFLP